MSVDGCYRKPKFARNVNGNPEDLRPIVTPYTAKRADVLFLE